MAQRVTIDSDKGLPDLVRQLADDSKRLIGDEVRLAKLESSESLREAGRGATWLGVAFGITVVSLVAFTIAFAAVIGRVANGHYWVGALLTAVVEIALGGWLVKRGLRDFTKAPYALPETRSGLRVLKQS